MASVLEAGEGGGALERLAERVDSLGSVRATELVDATDSVSGEAAKGSAHTALKAVTVEGAKSTQCSSLSYLT